MRELRAIILIIVAFMDCSDSQYPDCNNVTCPNGSIPLSPLSYNTLSSNVFNGTQPSNEGCTNGTIVSGQVTIDCRQGTTLIDCHRGFNGGDYSDLSRTFAWNRTTSIAQQVSIVFTFDQQINISRITMFFWNSQNNSIIIPNVRMYWGDYFDGSTVLTNGITITTDLPSRLGDGRHRLNIDIGNTGLQFQHLRIEMSFYGNSEWIFLSEVQFCGNTAPYHITQPSTDNDVQIVSLTATMATLMCSLNITIPTNMFIFWDRNGNLATKASNKNAIETSHGTTLLIGNPQSSDAGVYQCVFNNVAGDGWALRRNIRLIITTPSIIHPPNDSQVIIFNNSLSSVQLMCSLNVTIPSSMVVTWLHNGNITSRDEGLTAGNTTTLVIRNFQPSDAGVYQCMFNYRGWMLRRIISVATSSTTTTISSSTPTVTTVTTTVNVNVINTTSATATTAIITSIATGVITTITTTTTTNTSTTAAIITSSAVATTTAITTSSAVATTTAITTSTSTTAATSTTNTVISSSIINVVIDTTAVVTLTAAVTDDNTITTTTMKSRSIPVVSSSISLNDSNSPNSSSGSPNSSGGSSDSSYVGPIVAVIVVIILLIAIIVTILVIVFIWRRNKKSYDGFDKNSKQPPLSVTGLSISEKDEAIAKDNQEPSKANLELQNRYTFDPDHKPEGSAEVLVQSQEQTLSLINPGYQKTKPTADSEFPEFYVSNPRFSVESSSNSVFTDSINTSAFLSGKMRDSKYDDNAAPCTSIYADPIPLVKSKGPPVVSMDNIKEIRELGTGLFGKVILADTVGLSYQYLGIGNNNDNAISIKVAVKLLKSSASAEIKKAFDKEIKFMSRLKDDNVIRLLGICTTGTPFIMMEYMENGDLNNYLQKFKLATDAEKVPAANEITLIALVHISHQIASGMKYLSSCKFIHRDLASRNILVGINYTIKIADFGMSQHLYSAYYCRVGGRSVLPIRWMAYECFFGKFSVKTDVWAFGITLWEIFTLCRYLPFNDLTNQRMVEDAIKGAKRKIPDQPENCPDDIYCIMKSCLRHDPSERAEFKVLCDQLYNYYTNIL